MSKHQMIFLGAGPGGYAVALMAADMGLETALVGKGPDPGGVGICRGCSPSRCPG